MTAVGHLPSLCVCECVENLETDCCPLFMQNHLRIQFTLCCPASPSGKPLLVLFPPNPHSLTPFCSSSSPASLRTPPYLKRQSSAYIEDFFILTKVTVVYSEFGEKKKQMAFPVLASTGSHIS